MSSRNSRWSWWDIAFAMTSVSYVKGYANTLGKGGEKKKKRRARGMGVLGRTEVFVLNIATRFAL